MYCFIVILLKEEDCKLHATRRRVQVREFTRRKLRQKHYWKTRWKTRRGIRGWTRRLNQSNKRILYATLCVDCTSLWCLSDSSSFDTLLVISSSLRKESNTNIAFTRLVPLSELYWRKEDPCRLLSVFNFRVSSCVSSTQEWGENLCTRRQTVEQNIKMWHMSLKESLQKKSPHHDFRRYEHWWCCGQFFKLWREREICSPFAMFWTQNTGKKRSHFEKRRSRTRKQQDRQQLDFVFLTPPYILFTLSRDKGHFVPTFISSFSRLCPFWNKWWNTKVDL